MRTDKDCFPKVIKWLKPNLKDTNSRRYSNSVIRIIDLFIGKVDEDVSTITGKSTACQRRIYDILRYIEKCPLMKLLPKDIKNYLPLSNKAGPNGPCSVSALDDLTALLKDPKL